MSGAVGAMYATPVQAACSFIETALLGINLQQLFTYLDNCADDALWTKLLVAAVVVVSSLHTAFLVTAIWAFASTCLVDPTAFAKTTWVLAMDPLLTGVAAMLVQASYARKIYILSNRKAVWVVVVIVVLTVVQLVFGIYASCGMLRQHYETKYLTVFCSTLAACDVVIAVSFTYHLRQSRGGFKDTDRLIDRIVRHTIANNGITTAVAVATAVCFGAQAQGYEMVEILTRLYVLSFFSALDSRQKHRNEMDRTLASRQHRLTPLSFLPGSSSTPFTGIDGPPHLSIVVTGASEEFVSMQQRKTSIPSSARKGDSKE